MLADFHTHTLFSFDGNPVATVDAMCEAAIAKGLSHLALTDHCDINGEVEGLYAILDKKAVFEAIAAAKKKYESKLTVLFGIELGQATQYPAEAKALLECYPYDIVLGSLHNLAGEPDFCFMGSPNPKYPAPQFAEMTEAEIAAYFDRVLDETLALLDFDGICVLTHLTYMHRYVRRAGKAMDFAPFTEKLAYVFEKTIQKGVALELNTSTILREGISMPTPELLSLYRRCGGKLVSIGSDAHAPEAVAQNFDIGAKILTDCGFTEIAVPTAKGLLTFPIQ